MRLSRKLLISVVAVALPLGTVFVVAEPSAWAAGTVTGTGTINCTGVAGQLKFSPKLTVTGPATGTETIGVKLSFSGCNSGGGSNVTSTNFSGKATGTLTDNLGSNCSSLAASTPIAVSGSMSIKWKAKAGKAKLNPSTLSVTQFKDQPAGMNGNPAFVFGGSSSAAAGTVSGSFGSPSTSGEFDLAQGLGAVVSACGSGVKKLAIAAGNLATSAPPPPPRIATAPAVTIGSNGDYWIVVAPTSSSSHTPTGTLSTNCSSASVMSGTLADSGSTAAELFPSASPVTQASDYWGFDTDPLGGNFGLSVIFLACSGATISYSGDSNFTGF